MEDYPLMVWVPLLIVNNYSEFQVNIFIITDILEYVENSKLKRGITLSKKKKTTIRRITSPIGVGFPF